MGLFGAYEWNVSDSVVSLSFVFLILWPIMILKWNSSWEILLHRNKLVLVFRRTIFEHSHWIDFPGYKNICQQSFFAPWWQVLDFFKHKGVLFVPLLKFCHIYVQSCLYISAWKLFPINNLKRSKNGPLEFKLSHHSFSRQLCETDSSLRWPSHGES